MSLHFAHSINVEPVKFKPIEDAVHKISLNKTPLKNSTKFKGKHPSRKRFFKAAGLKPTANNLQKQSPVQVFYIKFC